jgi:hypothetical protein
MTTLPSPPDGSLIVPVALRTLRPAVRQKLARCIPLPLVVRREGEILGTIDRHIALTLGTWLATPRCVDLLEAGQIQTFITAVVGSVLDEMRKARQWERRAVQAEILDAVPAPGAPEPSAARPDLPATWLRAARRLLKKKQKPTLKNLAKELGITDRHLRYLRAKQGQTRPARRR